MFDRFHGPVVCALALAAGLCSMGCGRAPQGGVEIRIPEPGIRSLEEVRLSGTGKSRVVWAVSNLTPVVIGALPAGEYRVTLSFRNSNYRPPTEVEAGRLTVKTGQTQVFACGLLSFNIPEKLPDLNLSAVIVRGATGPVVELQNTGNTYYFFEPKPLPPDRYDVSLLYHRSAGPSVMATGLVVRAGETTAVTLNAGLQLKKPDSTRHVVGWSLSRTDARKPWVTVRRGRDNDEPLWRRYMAPPGMYNLSVECDPREPAPKQETVIVPAGGMLTHTPTL